MTRLVRFRYRPEDWDEVPDTIRSRLEAMDGWKAVFLPEDAAPWLHKYEPGDQRAWVEILGAHDLPFLPGLENFVPAPVDALEEIAAPTADELSYARAVHTRRLELLDDLFPAPSPEDLGGVWVDLTGLRGYAGLLISDTGGVWHQWTVDGAAESVRSLRGIWVPLGSPAPERLHRWSDNIYTNDGQLDAALLNGLLGLCAPGWRVADDLAAASCEAAVWVRCERDILLPSYTSDHGQSRPDRTAEQQALDAFAEENAEWTRSPLADASRSSQDQLVDRVACLVWGNSV